MIKTLQLSLSNSVVGVQQSQLTLGQVSFIPEYVDAAGRLWGVYVPLEAPPNQITVIPGNTVRFKVQFTYIGPAVNYTIHCSLGNNNYPVWGSFDEDEALSKDFSKTLTEHTSAYAVTELCDILVPTSYTDWGWKDAYCKIVSPKVLSPVYTAAVNIVQFIPTFSNMAITSFVKV